jgi:predicted nuclease of predicted toxin-antitoxin system
MNFLADENLDIQIVNKLRQDGHLVLYVVELDPGISDDEVLDMGNANKCLLVTADKDFGELFFRMRRVAEGIILVRLAGVSPDEKAEIVATVIAKYSSQLIESFTVISRGSIRIRKLPWLGDRHEE